MDILNEGTSDTHLEMDFFCEPPRKKMKLFEDDEKLNMNLFDVGDSGKVVELLRSWEHVLCAVEDLGQLVDLLVLLSYTDCGYPKLFLTEDDMFRMKPKTLRRATSYNSQTSQSSDSPPHKHTSNEGNLDNIATCSNSTNCEFLDLDWMKPETLRRVTSYNSQTSQSSDSPTHKHTSNEGSLANTPTCSNSDNCEFLDLNNVSKDNKSANNTEFPDSVSDGISAQLQVDCARLELGDNLGDVALVLSAFYTWWCSNDKDRLALCEKYLINVSEMNILGKAFQDLLNLIQRETGIDLIWVNSEMEKKIPIAERMSQWVCALIRSCPELLFVHSGVPGQEYMNFKTGFVEPHYLNRNFNFDPNVKPPEYVISFPGNVNVSNLKECLYNLLTIKCEPQITSEMCRILYPEDFKARQQEKVIKAAVISDIGAAVVKKLHEKEPLKLSDMEHDISVQCGIPYVFAHVQVDLPRNQLHIYVPKSCAAKAQEVAQYHVDVAKAAIEMKTIDICPYKGSRKTVRIGAGGILHGMSYQEEAEKTALIYVNTTFQNRKTLYENFSAKIMKSMLLVHGIEEENFVAIRKCQKFPEVTLWGSIIFKDAAIRKHCIARFNERFKKDGAKFHMKPVKEKKYEIYQRFDVKREVTTHVHVNFYTDEDFQSVKSFPWKDYWVMKRLKFYRSTREANFVFKLPRRDLTRLRDDITLVCKGAASAVMNLSHKLLRPDDWSDTTLQQVMTKARAEAMKGSHKLVSTLVDLRRAVIHQNDHTLQGYVRWESIEGAAKPSPSRLTTCLDDSFTMALTKSGELTSITVSGDTYRVLEDALSCYTASILDIVHENDGSVVILIVVGSIDEKEVLNLVAPEIIYGLDPQLTAMYQAGYCPFLYLCKEQSVAVEVSTELRQMKLYGMEKHRTEAAQLIRGILAQSKSGAVEIPNSHHTLKNYSTFSLQGPDVPNNLLKEMFLRWGTKLETLQHITGSAEVVLDSLMDNLHCVGSANAIHKVKVALDELCTVLTGQETTIYSLKNSCCACFAEICDITMQSNALEHCGHIYCMDCLVTQINTHIKNKAQPMLPISCAKAECGALMSTHDILTACTKGSIHAHEFLDAVYRQHITDNRESVRHCTTDWCGVVYEVPVKGYGTFHCPACQGASCINCNTPWHPGLSCVVKTLIDNLEDERLREWIMADAENRKICPECHVGIEKNGGCAMVGCAGGAHTLCWKCMSVFKTSTECYAHINKQNC